MPELTEIIGEYPTFLDEVLAEVKSAGFDLKDFVQIDHLCYRTVSQANYNQKKSELSRLTTLLSETTVNQRPIATFRLLKPIFHRQWRIDAIELPAPKIDDTHKEGLEHIELVLYDDIPIFLKKYPAKPFDLKAADRGINPEIGLKLNKHAVKFHLLSLTTVVYLEHKLGITEVKDTNTE